MPTPEVLRWTTCELAITMLGNMASEASEGRVAKHLAYWFPDATPEEAAGLLKLSRDHFEAYALWLRNHSNRQIDAGQYKEGRHPE